MYGGRGGKASPEVFAYTSILKTGLGLARK